MSRHDLNLTCEHELPPLQSYTSTKLISLFINYRRIKNTCLDFSVCLLQQITNKKISGYFFSLQLNFENEKMNMGKGE